jgi:hypothetical protein
MGARPKIKPPLYVDDVLTFAHCQELAAKMALVDQQECLMHGHSPMAALATATMVGYSRAVIRRRTRGCVGAFGFSPTYGTIWSLWAPLGVAESALVLKESRGWITKMRHLAAADVSAPLFNHVSADNERVLKWLDATGCFALDLDPDRPGFHRLEVSL